MKLLHHHAGGKSVNRGVLGAVVGYVTLALASTLVQETWLGGVSYGNSERSVLILAGVFTPLCALLGGLVSAIVAGRARWLAAGILSGLIAVETTYLYSTQRVDGPLWFEAGAAAALILAVCAATWLCERYATRTLSPEPIMPILALSLAVATRTANGSAPIAVTALIALSTRRPAGDVQRRRPRTRPT